MAYDLVHQAKLAKEYKKKHEQILKKANQSNIIKKLPRLHDEVFEEIDCLQCANCCKNYSPRFNATDIKRISKYLKIKEADIINQYLYVDQDEDYVLKSHPCPFLGENNECDIYDVRPRDCARYPYIDEDVFVNQVKLSIKNIEVCPAAYKMIEKIENILITK